MTWRKKDHCVCHFQAQSQRGKLCKDSIHLWFSIIDIFKESIHIKVRCLDGISMLTASAFSKRIEARKTHLANLALLDFFCPHSRTFLDHVLIQGCLRELEKLGHCVQ